MRIRTLLRYLLGDRAAILEIATDRRALWIGLLFVISAGLAREYDGEDLLHEPWYVFIPVGASLVTSFVLFAISYGVVIGRGAPGRSFFPAYRGFLSLFWMTAPLAWLYAVPYERFLSPAGAMQANLATLGVVAAWRVVLMIRVLVVVMGYRPLAAACIVLGFADAIVLALLPTLPVPLIDIMGGIRLPESQAVLRNTACLVCQAGVCSAPVWLIGIIVVCSASKPAWQVPPSPTTPAGQRSLWMLAALALLIWAPILAFTQPEQTLRRDIERLFAQGRIDEAIATISAQAPDDFPPQWDPPPPFAGNMAPANTELLLRVCETLVDTPAAPWLRTSYIEKLRQLLDRPYFHSDENARVARLLLRLPEGNDIIADVEQRQFRFYESELGQELRWLRGEDVKRP